MHIVLFFCCYCFLFCTLSSLVPRPSKLQRQSSLCHSCRYARIHHVPSFHSPNFSPTMKSSETSFVKTTSSTNLTESLSSSSLVAASAASTLSSAAAITEKNPAELISLISNHRLSTSSLPFSILNGDSGVYGSRISIADDVYEQLCEKPKQSVSFSPSPSSALLDVLHLLDQSIALSGIFPHRFSFQDNHKAFLPRDHCVKELLDTELNYRDSLHQIVTVMNIFYSFK